MYKCRGREDAGSGQERFKTIADAVRSYDIAEQVS